MELDSESFNELDRLHEDLDKARGMIEVARLELAEHQSKEPMLKARLVGYVELKKDIEEKIRKEKLKITLQPR